jgi:hypothetical protein
MCLLLRDALKHLRYLPTSVYWLLEKLKQVSLFSILFRYGFVFLQVRIQNRLD